MHKDVSDLIAITFKFEGANEDLEIGLKGNQ
jgi:hypothetical protein